ncbi:1637_t:CDS:2, partial [Acaulospora colombiana]
RVFSPFLLTQKLGFGSSGDGSCREKKVVVVEAKSRSTLSDQIGKANSPALSTTILAGTKLIGELSSKEDLSHLLLADYSTRKSLKTDSNWRMANLSTAQISVVHSKRGCPATAPNAYPWLTAQFSSTISRDSSKFTMASSSGETVDYGMKIWADGTSGGNGHPEIDIVAVQGLGADPYWTWVSKGNSQRPIWLRDFLPLDIPNARISSWGYNSKFKHDAPVTGLDVCGSDLLVALSHHRKGDTHRVYPDISDHLKALVLAHNRSEDADFERILGSTVGMIFLGTPHRGAHSAQLGSILVQAATLLGASCKKELLKTLVYESKEVLKLDEQFAWVSSSKELVVTQPSASIHRQGARNISLDCNHSQMNKFGSKDDSNYVKVAGELQRMVEQALNEQKPTVDEEKILKNIKPKDLEDSCPHEPCLDGTRQDIFGHINKWVTDMDAPNILWIKGYPGVGKSAIASTMVSHLRDSGRLGSSFFFQRERSTTMNTRVLWQKVAFDLALRFHSVRAILVSKLQKDGDK